MGVFSWFISSWKKKKAERKRRPIVPPENKNNRTLQIKIEHVENGPEASEARTSSVTVPVPFPVLERSTCEVKVINHNISPATVDAGEEDYEGGDEHDEALSMKREHSDFDLQARIQYLNGEDKEAFDSFQDNMNNNNDTEESTEMLKNGHFSDPGTMKEESWAPWELKRSCSDLVMRRREFSELFPPEDVRALSGRFGGELFVGDAANASPVSVTTPRSADKVMLKKHSSSQILPSGSRKIWWKLFLWSHRNLHRAGLARPNPVAATDSPRNQQGGYCSDTLETRLPEKSIKEVGSPGSFNGFSGTWGQNQWIALPMESSASPFTRVDEWVKETYSVQQPPMDDNHGDDHIDFPPSPENGGMLGTRGSLLYHGTNMPEEITHANSVIQSLNGSSTVAHMAGIGLKVIPSMSHLSSLRSLNLSGNFIVHIAPGSLPKGLHVLNLSRNKIHTIEGLREMTRLRVLDLSYNRISRIGQGLSNCTLIKELYLSGNKISNVEGLHRLLKLTVLDLSFNKITTTKGLGQLVANYNSLMALNLLGNPIQSNISDEQLRKTVCSLLPKLAFLNKQPVNAQKAREICAVDTVAKAALGSADRVTRKKPTRRALQSTATAGRHNAGRQGSTATAGRRNAGKLGSSASRGRHHSTAATAKQHRAGH